MLPANHDDRALYHYLRRGRGQVPVQLLYRVARERIAAYESARGKDWKKVQPMLAAAVARFQSFQELREEAPSPPYAVWPLLLKLYQKQLPEQLPAPLPKGLQYHYAARDVLLLALARKEPDAYTALVEAYEAPARKYFQREYSGASFAFEDVYQEAFTSLIKSPPKPEGPHTAQLYSIFQRILQRRAADEYRKEQRQSGPDTLKPDEEGNNSEGFTDHIIERYALNERFGTDDEVKIVRDGLESLDDKCRDLLRLRYFRGLRFREIAERLDHSTNSMGTRLSRCLEKFRKILFNS